MLVAVPAGPHGVLVLFADRLALYVPAGRAWKAIKRRKETRLGDFLQIVPGFSEDYWITGTTGLARLELPVGAGAGRWTERDTLEIGMRKIGYPHPAGRQEVFFSGRVSGGSRWAVARWNARELKIVQTSRQNNVTGWRGPDGEIWILDGATLFRLIGGKRQPVTRSDSLAGTIFDVLTEPSGGFWLATSEGLAHCNPPLWRTPVEVADLDAPAGQVMVRGHGIPFGTGWNGLAKAPSARRSAQPHRPNAQPWIVAGRPNHHPGGRRRPGRMRTPFRPGPRQFPNPDASGRARHRFDDAAERRKVLGGHQTRLPDRDL
jgi:hypothetical protein